MTCALIVVDDSRLHPNSREAIEQAKANDIYVWTVPLTSSKDSLKNRLINMVMMQGKTRVVVADAEHIFKWADIDEMFAAINTGEPGWRGPSLIGVTKEWAEGIGQPSAPHHTDYISHISGMRRIGGGIAKERKIEKPPANTVGIVVTFHNQNQHVSQVIASIRNQTRKFQKVIIVDDSSDIQVDCANRGIKLDKEMSFVRVEYGDKCKARNAGAAHLETEYVVFLDGDNWIEETFLENLLRGIGPNVGVVYPSLVIHNADGTLKEGATSPTRQFNKAMLLRNNVAETSSLIRRDVFIEAGRWPEDRPYFMEDWEMWMKIDAMGYELKHQPNAVLHYRRVNFHTSEEMQKLHEGSKSMGQRTLFLTAEDCADSIRRSISTFKGDRIVIGRGQPWEVYNDLMVENDAVIAGPTDSWDDRIRRGACPGEFAGIACYFNPAGFETPKKNFSEFRARANFPLYTVEAVFPGQTPSMGCHHTVRAEHILWHKERLLNQLVRKLPTYVKKVAWIDGDLLLPAEWHVETAIALEKHPVVQAFGEAHYLDQERRVARRRNSLGKNLAIGVKRPFRFNDSHPGFVWAAKRELWTEGPGLMDRHPTGGADSLMAFALCDVDANEFAKRVYDADMLDYFDNYRSRLRSFVGGNVGFVDCEIKHLWHGETENREYVPRLEQLKGFDPFNGLEEGESGLFKWKEDWRHKAAKAYFARRKEDG